MCSCVCACMHAYLKYRCKHILHEQIYLQCNIEVCVLFLPAKDHDHDSKVSLEDYRTTIQKERLLIEAFGPCLPSRQVD